MTQDIDILRAWIRIVLVLAAICTTAVPILYSFTPWRSRPIGQMFMLQAVSFATAMDLSTFFAFWRPSNVMIVFWVRVVMLTLIAISTAAIAWLMVRLNYLNKKGWTDGRHRRERPEDPSTK